MYAIQINNVHDLQEIIRNEFETIRTTPGIFQRVTRY